MMTTTAMYNEGTTMNRTTKSNAIEDKRGSKSRTKTISASMRHIKSSTSATPILAIACTTSPRALLGQQNDKCEGISKKKKTKQKRSEREVECFV